MSKRVIQLGRRGPSSLNASIPNTGTKRVRITGPEVEARTFNERLHGPGTSSLQSNETTVEAEGNPVYYPELCSDSLLIECLSRVLVDPSGLASKTRSELISLVHSSCMPIPPRRKRAKLDIGEAASGFQGLNLKSTPDTQNGCTPPRTTNHSRPPENATVCDLPNKRQRTKSPIRFP